MLFGKKLRLVALGDWYNGQSCKTHKNRYRKFETQVSGTSTRYILISVTTRKWSNFFVPLWFFFLYIHLNQHLVRLPIAVGSCVPKSSSVGCFYSLFFRLFALCSFGGPATQLPINHTWRLIVSYKCLALAWLVSFLGGAGYGEFIEWILGGVRVGELCGGDDGGEEGGRELPLQKKEEQRACIVSDTVTQLHSIKQIQHKQK